MTEPPDRRAKGVPLVPQPRPRPPGGDDNRCPARAPHPDGDRFGPLKSPASAVTGFANGPAGAARQASEAA